MGEPQNIKSTTSIKSMTIAPAGDVVEVHLGGKGASTWDEFTPNQARVAASHLLKAAQDIERFDGPMRLTGIRRNELQRTSVVELIRPAVIALGPTPNDVISVMLAAAMDEANALGREGIGVDRSLYETSPEGHWASRLTIYWSQEGGAS